MTETMAAELEPQVEDGERFALLAEVRGSVLRLLAELPRLPERMRVSARDVVVELEWPEPAPHVVAAPGLAPEPSGMTTDTGIEGRPPAGEQITAPTVGIFYRSPEPGAPPFVEVGDPVWPGRQVAILEAMKLMLPVEADRDGIVMEVLYRDGQPVEYGEPLFAIELTAQD